MLWQASSTTTQSNSTIAEHFLVDRRRGADHVGRIEHVANRLPFQLARFGLELLRFAAHVLLGAAGRLGPRVSIGLLIERFDFAQQIFHDAHVVVRFDDRIERVAAQFFFDAGRMPDANDALTAGHQPFEQIIDRRVARRKRELFRRARRLRG